MTTPQGMLELAEEALEQAQDCIKGETPEDMTVEEARDDTISKIRDALRAIELSRQAAAPQGREADWQLVPKEPTKEMIQACIWALDRWREKHGNVQGFVPPGDKYQVRWRAMLAAAPSAPCFKAAQNFAESDPSVTLDCHGAETIDELVAGITPENCHPEIEVTPAVAPDGAQIVTEFESVFGKLTATERRWLIRRIAGQEV